MRPLVLTENYPPDRGGMAQSCDRVVRSLRATGLPVDVAHLGRREHRSRLERQEGGVFLTSPFDDDPSHAINLLWNEISRLPDRPSHVVAFGGATPVLAGPAVAAWLGVPLVTLLRGNDFDTGLFSLRRGWVLRDALARSAAVATVTRDHQRKVAALFPSADVRFFPNGIDPAEWSLVAHDLERAARWRGERLIGEPSGEKRKYRRASGGPQLCEVKAGDGGFKLRTADGKLLWKVKVVDASDKEIAEVRFYPDKTKVKSAAGVELWECGSPRRRSAAFGVLALDRIPEEHRAILMAEILARRR